MPSSRHANRPTLTRHASQRAKERGIRALQLELIHLFGEDRYQKGGATLSSIPHRRLAELRAAIDCLKDVTIVKGADDRVVTAMHECARVARTEWAS